ncbi:hypothetical protein GEMRC1_004618 [Eukaryota sp. GEM-RC1]
MDKRRSSQSNETLDASLNVQFNLPQLEKQVDGFTGVEMRDIHVMKREQVFMMARQWCNRRSEIDEYLRDMDALPDGIDIVEGLSLSEEDVELDQRVVVVHPSPERQEEDEDPLAELVDNNSSDLIMNCFSPDAGKPRRKNRSRIMKMREDENLLESSIFQ